MQDLSLPPYRRIAICAAAIALFVLAYGDRAVLSAAMPVIAKEFHLDAAQTGWVLSSFLWSYIILNFPVSLLVDRLPARITGAVTLFVWSIAMLVGGFAGSLGVFIASRIMLGIGESPTFPLATRIVRQWSSEGSRGTVLTILVSSSQIGLAVGLLGSGWLSASSGWRVAFVVYGTLSIVFALAWIKLVPSEAPRPKKIRDSLSVLGLLRQRSFWGLVLPGAAGQYGNFLMMAWLPTYLHSTFALSVFQTGVDASLCYVAATALSIGLGKICDSTALHARLGRASRRLVVAAFLLLSSCVAALPLVHQVWLVLALIAVAVGTIMAALGANTALASDLLEDGSRIGSVTGFSLIFSNGMGLAAPVVTGYLVKFTGGFQGAFVVAGMILCLGAILAIALPRRSLRL